VSAPQIGTHRILGLDYGSARIGVSLSDPLQILATAYGVVKHSPAMWEELAAIVSGEQVELVVVGMPTTLKGEMGPKAREAQKFGDELRSRLKVPVVYWAERFTTSIARRTRIVLGTKRSDRRRRDGELDAMAASVMLQGFLDSRKGSVCA